MDVDKLLPNFSALHHLIEVSESALDDLDLGVPVKWDAQIKSACPISDFGGNDDELRLIFRKGRRLNRLRWVADTLLDSGVAPPKDIATWALSCISRQYEYQVVSGLFEIRMAQLLYECLGDALQLTDIHGGGAGPKVTDFRVANWPVEVKALQGANPKGVADNAEKAEKQHASVRAADGTLNLGVTAVGLAKEGLDDDSKKYILAVAESACAKLLESPNTGCILLLVEELRDVGGAYEDKVHAARLVRPDGGGEDTCPPQLVEWCPKPLACTNSVRPE